MASYKVDVITSPPNSMAPTACKSPQVRRGKRGARGPPQYHAWMMNPENTTVSTTAAKCSRAMGSGQTVGVCMCVCGCGCGCVCEQQRQHHIIEEGLHGSPGQLS